MSDKDTIYRQDAIDAISYSDIAYYPEDSSKDVLRKDSVVKKAISELPSAQPEIIRCKDCMHNGSFDTDCPIHWNGKEYCSFAERRNDE